MPAPLTLAEHCRRATFRSRRHHELLAGPAVPFPELASIQGRYVAATHELERRAIGVEFERAVREAAERDRGADRDGLAELERIINMPPAPYDPEQDRARSERFARAVRARDLRRDGIALQAIAERIGVSRTTVRRYLA